MIGQPAGLGAALGSCTAWPLCSTALWFLRWALPDGVLLCK